MICPKCGEKLTLIEKNGVEVDYCENCKGVWFDLFEIDELSDAIEKFNIVAPRLENMKIAETMEEKCPCPRCAALMYKTTMRGKPPVFDFCPNNHGYWFDNKELEEYVKNNLVAVEKPSVSLLKKIIKG